MSDVIALTMPQDSGSRPSTSTPTLPPPQPQKSVILNCTGSWVNYPPIPDSPQCKRYWLYGWRIDRIFLDAWVVRLRGPKPTDRFSSTWNPYVAMSQYSGYDALFPVLAVPEDVEDPVDGVSYECAAWALSSNYSKKRFYTRPDKGQMERIVGVLGEPYWFLDGLGNPRHHYQYYT